MEQVKIKTFFGRKPLPTIPHKNVEIKLEMPPFPLSSVDFSWSCLPGQSTSTQHCRWGPFPV